MCAPPLPHLLTPYHAFHTFIFQMGISTNTPTKRLSASLSSNGFRGILTAGIVFFLMVGGLAVVVIFSEFSGTTKFKHTSTRNPIALLAKAKALEAQLKIRIAQDEAATSRIESTLAKLEEASAASGVSSASNAQVRAMESKLAEAEDKVITDEVAAEELVAKVESREIELLEKIEEEEQTKGKKKSTRRLR